MTSSDSGTVGVLANAKISSTFGVLAGGGGTTTTLSSRRSPCMSLVSSLSRLVALFFRALCGGKRHFLVKYDSINNLKSDGRKSINSVRRVISLRKKGYGGNARM